MVIAFFLIYVLGDRSPETTAPQDGTAGQTPFMTLKALTVDSCEPVRQNMNQPA